MAATHAKVWHEADVAARLGRILGIAERVLKLFAVDGYLDDESPQNNLGPEKPMAEAAMLAYAASRARRIPGVATRLEAVAQTLAVHARSPQTLLKMALHPTFSQDYAFSHILLSRIGYGDPVVDAYLTTCMTSLQHGHERPPVGFVEQRWLASLAGGEADRSAWSADVESSVLFKPIDLLGGQREDAYAFTHLLMYLTDFGSRPDGLPDGRSTIFLMAEALLAKCLVTEDYDLAGEVLLCWPYLGHSWGAAATFVFRVLTRLEDAVGVVPGGTTRPDRLNRLEGEARTRYALGTAYHTAFVMGLVYAALLGQVGNPEPVIDRDPGISPEMLTRLERELESGQASWQEGWQELPATEREVLAPFLLDMVILQACSRRDYAAVGRLLELAVENGMADSVISVQAAMLLDRLGACSDVIQRQRKNQQLIDRPV